MSTGSQMQGMQSKETISSRSSLQSGLIEIKVFPSQVFVIKKVQQIFELNV